MPVRSHHVRRPVGAPPGAVGSVALCRSLGRGWAAHEHSCPTRRRGSSYPSCHDHRAVQPRGQERARHALKMVRPGGKGGGGAKEGRGGEELKPQGGESSQVPTPLAAGCERQDEEYIGPGAENPSGRLPRGAGARGVGIGAPGPGQRRQPARWGVGRGGGDKDGRRCM